MKIGPKYKICKRLGSAVFDQCATQKFALSESSSKPGQRGGKPGGRMGAGSEFKRQHIEKQKIRFSYGVGERQLSRYVSESMQNPAGPARALVNRLESRLDNVVYRLGIAKTRRLARQMVSHGHITVRGRKTTVPSYQVQVSDVIAVREGSKTSPLFQQLLEGGGESDGRVPSWLSFDLPALRGEKKADPISEKTEYIFDPVQVLEYYSR
jgi:small subunit ribosomal protein S4